MKNVKIIFKINAKIRDKIELKTNDLISFIARLRNYYVIIMKIKNTEVKLPFGF